MIKIRHNFIVFSLLLLLGCYSLPEQEKFEPDPNSAFKFYSTAMNLYLDGKYQDALINVNTAIKNNPFIAQFYQLKGDILKNMLEYSDALEAYEKSVNIRAYNPELFEKMGIVSSDMREYDQAIQFHKKALAQDPSKLELNLRIAENYYWMEHLNLALNFADNYRKKMDLMKNQYGKDYFRIMGNIKYAQHKTEAAIEYYERYFNDHDAMNTFEAKALLHAYLELEKREKAYQFLLNTASRFLSSGDTHFFRGAYYFKGQNLKDARIQFELALKAKSSEIDTYLYLGKIYYAAGEQSKALAMFKQYRKLGGSLIINEYTN